MRYASIRELDISNGDGVGVSLFVQGCHFHCKDCFNQETWDFDGGKEWTPQIKEKFLKFINRPYIKRVSILGGEPLAEENLTGVLNLLNEIRLLSDYKKIWLYTGYTIEKIFPRILQIDLSQEEIKRQEIVRLCDILVDGQYDYTKRDLNNKFAGSTNQRVIDVKTSLHKGRITLWES